MQELACIPLGKGTEEKKFFCDWSSGREVIRTLEDVEDKADFNTYNLPAYQTLPSIDSFVVLDDEDAEGEHERRVLAFQMTVARSRLVKRKGVKSTPSPAGPRDRETGRVQARPPHTSRVCVDRVTTACPRSSRGR